MARPRNVEITDVASLRAAMIHVFNRARTGKIDPKTANTLGFLGNCILGLFQAEQNMRNPNENTPIKQLADALTSLRGMPGGNEKPKRANQSGADPTPP